MLQKHRHVSVVWPEVTIRSGAQRRVKTSSICTDGTNANIGEKGGLWKYFEDEIRRLESAITLTKIWCSAHRLELVWGDVCKIHTLINATLTELSSISSFFHQSGLRTSAIKQIAIANGLHFSKLPKLFTIRWTEFSATIVDNLLRSWQALCSSRLLKIPFKNR